MQSSGTVLTALTIEKPDTGSISTSLTLDFCVIQEVGMVPTALTLVDRDSGSISTALVLIECGLDYQPPDIKAPRFNIELGPIVTATNYFGYSKIGKGAIVDILTGGTDPRAIGIGHGISSAVVGSTGKVYLRIWLGPSNSWLYRVAYPAGVRDDTKEVVTIAEIPFIQSKYEW